MKKKQIFMFSGQGSQYYQMGKELYENNATFKKAMHVCNEIATPLLGGASLIDAMYPENKKGEAFDRLLYTSPALISVQYSMASLLKEKDILPDLTLGYSLGEIVAAIVSGIITLEDGLKLVINMAYQAEEKTPRGKMLAIVADKMIIANDPDLFSSCWLAGTNFPGNFVVSGLAEDILELQKALQKEGITTQELPVNQGFHCPLIDGMEIDFKKEIANYKIFDQVTPFISSYKTEIVEEITEDYFWEVIRYPVNFQRTILNLIEKEDGIFIDLGPSGSLATSVKYILSRNNDSVPYQIMNQYGRNLQMLEKFITGITVSI
ncbi:acyltransferase domain-containing protein [Flavobacteriaceae bacterium M23B6Z8]